MQSPDLGRGGRKPIIPLDWSFWKLGEVEWVFLFLCLFLSWFLNINIGFIFRTVRSEFIQLVERAKQHPAFFLVASYESQSNMEWSESAAGPGR